MAAADDKDITGDGGVLKRVLKVGTGSLPTLEPGEILRVKVNYEGRLLSGDVFDSSSQRGGPCSFLLGKGEVIQGWDAGIAAMDVGEEAEITIRADYAYGVSGKPSVIPPHATLVFTVELVEASVVSAVEAAPTELPALPAPSSSQEQTEQTETTDAKVVTVGGNPVKIDQLGPVVVNTDGSISRIANWHEMVPIEQENTLRIIGRRNQQRLAALRAAQQEEGKEQ